MTRKVLEQADHYPDTHPYHIECPRCGRHSVVLYSESIYVCLSCNWERDVSRHHHSRGDGPPAFLVLLALATVIVIVTIGG